MKQKEKGDSELKAYLPDKRYTSQQESWQKSSFGYV